MPSGARHRHSGQRIAHGILIFSIGVDATVIALDKAPRGYRDFDSGVVKKFVLDPHGRLAKTA
jgi:glutathione-independent formaldehyde dehydrogenase